MEFESFHKIHRLSRDVVISEKLDGTNAQIAIIENPEQTTFEFGFNLDGHTIFAGSRNRWLKPNSPDAKASDNYGFAGWVYANLAELLGLGVGRHYGEWWGSGIGRNYGLKNGTRRFSLFNTDRWLHPETKEKLTPACCDVVPILATGIFSDGLVDQALETLRTKGSIAEPGFMKPEGIVIYHVASRTLFKKTLDNDAEPKSLVKAV